MRSVLSGTGCSGTSVFAAEPGPALPGPVVGALAGAALPVALLPAAEPAAPPAEPLATGATAADPGPAAEPALVDPGVAAPSEHSRMKVLPASSLTSRSSHEAPLAPTSLSL